MKKSIVLAVAMITIVAACGGDSDAGNAPGGLSADEQAAAAEFAVGFKEGFDRDADGVTVTDAQATCVSENYVGAFGISRLEEIGDASDDINFTVPLDEAKQMASLFLDCVPMKDIVIESMQAGGDITESQVECLSNAISDEDIEALLVQTFAGEDTAPEAGSGFAIAMFSCLSP